jgi:hypothetical protein
MKDLTLITFALAFISVFASKMCYFLFIHKIKVEILINKKYYNTIKI